mmetsp:Transcript_116025/g.201448  ORF Transcript_116025/g.201448 Transcript_116025/m.201448 type:complete len:122 (+) Transcript_116025:324-689(+)
MLGEANTRALAVLLPAWTGNRAGAATLGGASTCLGVVLLACNGCRVTDTRPCPTAWNGELAKRGAGGCTTTPAGIGCLRKMALPLSNRTGGSKRWVDMETVDSNCPSPGDVTARTWKKDLN